MNTQTQASAPGLYVRSPDFGLDKAPLIWSVIPEFSLAYDGFSVVIPYVEYYLNQTINRVRAECGGRNPVLDEELMLFVRQEVLHSRYHNNFNKNIFEAGIEGLRELVERVSADLKKQGESRSLAFNVAYCAGFESIATYDARYIYEECDQFFAGADPRGANLLLWHVAEEFEHRSVCHDAFHAVSGNYFLRMYGMFYAFWHIGGAFMQAEQLMLAHYWKTLSPTERKASHRRSRTLFWRQLRYVAPRMLKILAPGYHPARLPVPQRIQSALDQFRSSEPINTLPIDLAA